MFFIIFFLILITGLSYVLWHIWLVLPLPALLKGLIVALCGACVLLLVAGLSPWIDQWPMAVSVKVYEIGTTSLIVLMYLTLAFLLLDVGRLLHLVPKEWLVHNLRTTLVLSMVLILLMVYGNIHYNHPKRQSLELLTDKPIEREMTFVMVSDLHLGYHNRRETLHKWVEMINNEHADAVLIAGDIVDRSPRPLTIDSMAVEFRKLNAPVFACLGNHEYYSGVPDVLQFYADAGIQLLRDTAIVFRKDMLIIGRDDRMKARRKHLKDLLPQPDSTHFTVLLDHQPYHLEEAEQAGVDFQFSGHTHHGQVWPISWITDNVYEKAYGSHLRGKTHYYITSGLGIWGAKVRIGTCSEYVVVRIKKKNKPIIEPNFT